eukprot:gnl/MRDRNA2_/MRDRNA2_134527_c0_seq1.p1 gnl/MRDRNA2_/MRDRNA2_134527_c0~~gnl/MRDRNA2_/MRDRNA2_134527_c0_seq1.p1  ORF type:complete len:335 (-),score=37.35 gnl/MRDRNA2_/MRDRNA2_134527_c0_seq1:77-1000(-)
MNPPASQLVSNAANVVGWIVLVSISLSLQGCMIQVPTHVYASWRQQPDYLVDFQYTLPGEYKPFLNSCSMEGLVMGMQCNGHGTCKPWDSADKNSPTFCECDTDWADPECRTKRKSQTVSFVLALVGGWIGADQFYLGNTGMGVVKLLSLGGFGILYLHDVVTIGTGAPYATVTRHTRYKGAASSTTFRVAQDLPQWLFVTCTMVWFYGLGFTLAGLSAQRYVRLKRAEFMLLNSVESRRPGLTAMNHDLWLSTNFPEIVRLKAQFAQKGKGKGKMKGPPMMSSAPPMYGATSMPSYMPAGRMVGSI